MKCLILLCVLVGSVTNQQIPDADNKRLMCYYDGVQEGPAKLSLTDLEPALKLCSHLIYGYASINPASNKLVATNEKLDLDGYRTVTDLKKSYPNLKVLLSVGGDKDRVDKVGNKYLTVLESTNARSSFIKSAYSLLKDYGFDGLDIAWQFPKNKPKEVHGKVGKLLKNIKKVFTGDFVIDEDANNHKDQFTAFIRELRNGLNFDGFLLGVSVLPNVNSSLFYDVREIVKYLDYVNLMAFDFQTPDRNPEIADFPAPLYDLIDRDYESNVFYQVQYWLTNFCPPTKIDIGIAGYGRAWKLTKDSGNSGVPPVQNTDKAAPAGELTKIEGILSWPEICADLLLQRVVDPKKRSGNYAYRLPDKNNKNGMWVGYDDPETAANKAVYVKSKGLGGVALVDLSFDDFRGSCTGEKYPILRAIKDHL